VAKEEFMRKKLSFRFVTDKTSAESTKTKRMYNHQLRDHYHVDTVVYTTSGQKVPILKITTVPRFKTSGLSGDEWRISAQLSIQDGDRKLISDHSHSIRDMATKLSMLSAKTPTVAWDKYPGVMRLYLKGSKVLEYSHPSLRSLACSLGWILLLGGEDPNWSAPDLKNVCDQPGCSSEASEFYKVKHLYHERTPLPENPYHDNYVKFCQDHKVRGDSSFEDCDENYERIERVL
jgi:hypothetical protein